MGIFMFKGINYTGGVQQVYGEASGAIASFDDGGDNKPLKSLKLAINPVQEGSGTPSPQNVRPLHGWTGANMTNNKKNMLDVSQLFNDTSYYTQNSDGSITILQTNGKAWTSDSIEPYFLKKGTYTITRSNTIGILYVRCSLDNYATNIVTTTSTSASGTFTLSDDCYIKIKPNTGSSSTYPNTTFLNISIGSESEPYEPFYKDTYPITWSDAGEVFGGYIEFKDGERKAYKTWKRGQIKDLSWTYYSSSNVFRNQTIKNVNVMTEIYKTVPYVSWNLLNNYEIECGASDLIIKDTDYSDVTSFIAGVGDEYIFYEIEPEQFTLDSPLPTITTLLGNNNIWSDTGDVLECVYQRDLNIAINELFSRVAALEQASGTRSLSLSKSAVKEEETKEETKEEEQNEDKR